MSDKLLVDKVYILEKIPGKGGWTYARIPEIAPDKHAHFGWVRVKGNIDGFPIKNYHLMPMGNGELFLPVKSEIRKKIKKQEGDKIHVVLYPDNDPLEIPEELLVCLNDEPGALSWFQKYSESDQKWFIHWIESAKRDDTRISRLARTVEWVKTGQKPPVR